MFLKSTCTTHWFLETLHLLIHYGFQHIPPCLQAYADYIGFILTLNEGVKGKKLTCEYKVSEVWSSAFESLFHHFSQPAVVYYTTYIL